MNDGGPRIRSVNSVPVNEDGGYVLYWMIAARRVRFNFGLQRAADWSRHLGLPLVILEALRSDYRWASDRLHRFVVDGMADTAKALSGRNVTYYPYVEPEHGAGRGLLEHLANDAAVVVTDDFPTFFLPKMVKSAGKAIQTRLEAIDGNGLLPMRQRIGFSQPRTRFADSSRKTSSPTSTRFRSRTRLPRICHRGTSSPHPRPASGPPQPKTCFLETALRWLSCRSITP